MHVDFSPVRCVLLAALTTMTCVMLAVAQPATAQNDPEVVELRASIDGPPNVVAGGRAEVTITVENAGTEPVEDVWVTLQYRWAFYIEGDASCAGMTCYLASLAPGDSWTVRATAWIRDEAGHGTYAEPAVFSATVRTGGVTNEVVQHVAEWSVGVSRDASLAVGDITWQGGVSVDDEAAPGFEIISLNIPIENLGPASADVVVEIRTPEGLEFIGGYDTHYLQCPPAVEPHDPDWPIPVGAGGCWDTAEGVGVSAGQWAQLSVQFLTVTGRQGGAGTVELVIRAPETAETIQRSVPMQWGMPLAGATASAADLAVVIEGPGTVVAGEAVPLTVTVTNIGPGDAERLNLGVYSAGGISREIFDTTDDTAHCRPWHTSSCVAPSLAAGESMTFDTTLEVESWAWEPAHEGAVTLLAEVILDGETAVLNNTSRWSPVVVRDRSQLPVQPTATPAATPVPGTPTPEPTAQLTATVPPIATPAAEPIAQPELAFTGPAQSLAILIALSLLLAGTGFLVARRKFLARRSCS